MGNNKKWGVSAIFATGCFACICSIMRVVSSVRLINETDLTYSLVDQGLWANGEVGSGIIAGCMLSVPQFIRQVAPKLVKWISSISTRPRKSPSSAARDKLPSSTDPGSSGLATDTSGIRGDYIELEERGHGRASPFKTKTPAVSTRPVGDLQRHLS